MKPEDKKAFLVLMAMLSEAFNEQISAERGKIYFEFLEKHPLYEVSYAIKEAIRKNKFFPKISELLEPLENKWSSDIKSEESLYVKGKNKEALEYISKIAKLIGNVPKQKQIQHKMRSAGEEENGI